jgi:uncharacterized protein (DUF2062 family)
MPIPLFHRKNKTDFKSGLKSRLVSFLTRGTSAHDLAIAITVGLLIGIMPFIGLTTVLSTIIALRWKLNIPTILGVTYVVFPLQIVLIYPFCKFAAFVFKVQYLLPSTDSFLAKLSKDWLSTISGIGIVDLYALLIWLVFSIISGWFIYRTLLLLIKRMKFRSEPFEEDPGKR